MPTRLAEDDFLKVGCLKQILLTLGLCTWLASAAQAAEITEVSSELCDFSLTGEIKNGDAKELRRSRRAVQEFVNGSSIKLCLDSPGGSLTEGLKLFKEIWGMNIKTHVLPGAQCESACALAFLGGSYTMGTGQTRAMRREIWPDGRLGFHGPRLIFPAEQSFPGAQVSKAFEVALEIAAKMFELNRLEDRGDSALTDHLLHQFLLTSPDNMYDIETVGDVILSDITLNGVDYSNIDVKEVFLNVCNNIYLEGEFPLLEGHTETIHRDFTSTAALKRSLLKDQSDSSFAIRIEQDGDLYKGVVGPYFIMQMNQRIYCFSTFRDRKFAFDDYETSLDNEVLLSLFNGTPESGEFSYKRWVEHGDTVEVRSVPPWYMLDFATPLSDLPKSAAYHSARRQYEQHSGRKTSFTAPSAAEFVAFPGFDLPGGDIGLIRNANLATCKQSCDAKESCSAYTYDRWNNLCFLKSATSTSSRIYIQPKADSYVTPSLAARIRSARTNTTMKKRSNKAFPGSPYRDFGSSSYSQCASFCRDAEKCRGVNFSNNVCEMFDHPEVYNDRAGTEIGIKHQQLAE